MRFMLACLWLLSALLPAQQFHVANHHGTDTFEGWVRRGIDWKPAQLTGRVQGRPYAVGRDLGTGARVLDVLVSVEPGEVLTLDFGKVDEPSDATEKPAAGAFSAPTPTIGGAPFALRSAKADGAGLDVHWRTRIGELWFDLWCVLYPGQTWCTGELQISAHGPSRVAMVPDGFVLEGGDGWQAQVLGATGGGPVLPSGTTIAAGQGYSTLPVVLWTDGDLESPRAAGDLAIGAIGVQAVWPLGNPSWVASRGSAQKWLTENYARARANLLSWNADKLGIVANAATTGGEGDQTFVGAECGRGAESAGCEIVNLMVAYGYARRPGKWREANGDALALDAHPQLSMFEGYPGTRYGGSDTLGLSGVPNRAETHGWWEWREHMFRNRLFVAYRLTGSLALQWQIDQLARQYLFEHTLDGRFSTTAYTGALRGYGWSALMVWWLHHSLEDRAVAAAVRERWVARWERIGSPRWGSTDFWDVRRDDRLGPGLQLLAYQQAAATMFVDMAATACGRPDAQDAALRGAASILDHAFAHNGSRWVGYQLVQMVDGKPVPVPEGGQFGPGVESWMVSAAAVVVRRKPAHEQAQAIVRQFVAENNVNGQWIAPDVLPKGVR